MGAGIGLDTTDVQPRLAPTEGVDALEGLLDGGRDALLDVNPPRRSASFPRLDPELAATVEDRSGLGILVSILRISWTLQRLLVESRHARG